MSSNRRIVDEKSKELVNKLAKKFQLLCRFFESSIRLAADLVTARLS
jgi:hypothetical protein